MHLYTLKMLEARRATVGRYIILSWPLLHYWIRRPWRRRPRLLPLVWHAVVLVLRWRHVQNQQDNMLHFCTHLSVQTMKKSRAEGRWVTERARMKIGIGYPIYPYFGLELAWRWRFKFGSFILVINRSNLLGGIYWYESRSKDKRVSEQIQTIDYSNNVIRIWTVLSSLKF